MSYPPVISDGEANGNAGMKYSLVSREVIADFIELMHFGYMGISICISSLDSLHIHITHVCHMCLSVLSIAAINQ